MGKLILIFLMAVSSFASTVLNISYFPSDKKVDILFSLDEPFHGKVSMIKQNDYKITGITLNRIEQKQIDKNLNIIISGLDQNSVELRIIYDRAVNIKASLTAKGYGLRIRLLNVKTPQENTQFVVNNQPTIANNGFNLLNYILVIAILIVLIIILLVIKKKTLQKLPADLQKDNYKLLYQKMIDPKNRIVLIEIFDKRYLLLLGDKNNLLLDNFSQNHQEELKDISSQNKFDSLLEEKLEENDFIKKASQLKDLDGI